MENTSEWIWLQRAGSKKDELEENNKNEFASENTTQENA